MEREREREHWRAMCALQPDPQRGGGGGGAVRRRRSCRLELELLWIGSERERVTSKRGKLARSTARRTEGEGDGGGV